MKNSQKRPGVLQGLFGVLIPGALFFISCASQKPPLAFSAYPLPAAPDYAKPECWAALPGKSVNPAERIPADLQGETLGTEVDVFFIHPTTLLGKKAKDFRWNGDVYDSVLNAKTDNTTILLQASAFNAAGKIYAPRYRQAHLQAYFTRDTATARQAFSVAYSDVKKAFQYYLEHYNKNRPFIIASHSQGTTHAKRLIKEIIDQNPRLRNKLVAAYIIGIPVEKNLFEHIPVCSDSLQTGCFCSWRTWQRGYTPDHYAIPNNVAVVNPLNWRADTTYAPASLNLGAVLTGFKKIRPGVADAQAHEGLLWVSKPKIPFAWLTRQRNFHPGDINLFYMNVRKDAKRRVGYFWKQ